jgi:alpha-tubulin suppressor-like RCC1 family protein
MTTPTVVATGVIKVATSMGGTEGDSPMTAILRPTGEVFTVGSNSSSQLGRGGEKTVLTKLDLDFKVKDISCGLDHMILIAENGDMYGVGNNVYGQLGRNNLGGAVNTVTKIETDVVAAAAGRRHTVYIKSNGDLYVLGDNRWNKFKADYKEIIDEPLLLGSGFRFVSTGQHNCLAIDNDGNCYYFGWRSPTSFNAGESAATLTKIAENVKSAYIQDEHAILLSEDGKVYGFGLNNFGQIAPDLQNKMSPYLIIEDCISGGAGTHYSAAIKSNGEVWLWGNNSQGTIGNGNISDSYTAPYKALTIK